MKQKDIIALATKETSTIRECPILEQVDGKITFAVDEGLKKPSYHLEGMSGEDVTKEILWSEQIDESLHNVVSSSFSGKNLSWERSDVLFGCFLQCYAEHRPIVLSPDIIWLVINQQLAKHIAYNAEKFRSLIVSHEGTLEITIESNTDILTENTDWSAILNGFYNQIDAKTLNGIAKDFVADFSTTGTDERIASVVTLMKGVESYFKYTVHHMICGIPSVTLTGTPDDWKLLQQKCNILKKFGLTTWYQWLNPILTEFIRAAEGHPHLAFWKNTVQSGRDEDFSLGGGCIPDSHDVDGWCVALFLYDEDDEILSFTKADSEASMVNEMTRVGFKYVREYPDGSKENFPMELWSGIIGISEDESTYALTPQIGWFVRKSNEQAESLERLRQANEEDALNLYVDEVPIELNSLETIKSLALHFNGKVSIPDWLLTKNIRHLEIYGKVSEEERKLLEAVIPEVEIWD